jgi:hypothetical protein
MHGHALSSSSRRVATGAREDELEAEEEAHYGPIGSVTARNAAFATCPVREENEMNWKAMADKAKQTFQQRGGSTAAKQDAEELRDIAQGQGSLADKAKQAAAAIREPGAHHPDPPEVQSRDRRAN